MQFIDELWQRARLQADGNDDIPVCRARDRWGGWSYEWHSPQVAGIGTEEAPGVCLELPLMKLNNETIG
jgi:hypothetical protein